MNIAILGASPKEIRYSNRAQRILQDLGHDVFPVNPKYESVLGSVAYEKPSDINKSIDILSIYVNSEQSSLLVYDIVKSSPSLVIFNPGSENNYLQEQLTNATIPYLHACTILLAESNQLSKVFDERSKL